MRYTYTTKPIREVQPGEVIAELGQKITQVIPTKKGDRMQVWHGKAVPTIMNPERVVQVAIPHEDR